MPKFDVTKLNVAIDRLLETTVNSRDRFLLVACSRHRYLQVAGHYVRRDICSRQDDRGSPLSF